MVTDMDVRKEDNMLQTNDYQEAKEYFERNCQYGWQHIRAWIVSPQFYTMYFKDKVKAPGAVIRLAPMEDYVEAIQGVNHTIKGYKMIVSTGFSEEFGVCYIADRGLSEAASKLLEQNVSQDYNLKA